MMKFGSQLEEFVYNKFKTRKILFHTNTKVYDVRTVKPTLNNLPYDFSLNVANKIIAIVEVKNPMFFNKFDYTRIEKYALENNIPLIIVTDGVRFIIYDKKNPESKGELNFEELIEAFTQRNNINIEGLKIQISERIKLLVDESKFSFLKNNILELMSKMANEIEYNDIDAVFSFKKISDINNIENKIFRFLLKEDIPLKKIYRYTTLNTIYSMLNHNSFRMNCLVGMNDTTEVNYAQNYITNIDSDYVNEPWQTVDAYNRRFISSCSLKEDDLTQWRLYSEDCKGVCLVLNVNERLLNSKFVLKRISYGEKDGTHPELDFIIKIISDLKFTLNIDFEFKTLNTWRHFFKPFDYAIEEEVRLLYILQDDEVKKGWQTTSSHSILNPYVEFKLNNNDLPVQLKEIILGAKFPEKDINKKQFEQFIRELKRKKEIKIIDEIEQEVDVYNIPNLKVSISKIKNYR